MSGGGGTNTVTNSGPPEWAVPYYQSFFNKAGAVSDLPYQPYTGQRQADLNPLQSAGLNATANRALQGSQEVGQARQQLGDTLTGQYLGYQTPQNQNANAFNQLAGVQNQNANAFNPLAGVQNQNQNAFNPLAGVQNQSADAYNSAAQVQNPYFGSNPFLQKQIDAAQGDVVNQFNNVTRPQLESQMARSGSFGNSGLQQMQGAALSDLTKNLGNISNNLRFQDYTTQQGLGENAVNRLFQAGSQQAGNQFAAGENAASRLYGAGQQQAGNQFAAGENAASRLYGAGQQLASNQFASGQQSANNLFGAGQQLASNQFSSGENLANRQDQGFQNERQRQLAAIGLSPTLANQDYIDASALSGVGDVFQRQQQQGLDTQYQNFLEARNYPYQQLAPLASALGLNTGGTSSQSSNGGGSSAASGLGGAAAGASLAPMLGITGPYGAAAGAALGLLGGK